MMRVVLFLLTIFLSSKTCSSLCIEDDTGTIDNRPARKECIPLKNKLVFESFEHVRGDFQATAYYLSPNSGELIVRRHDDERWDVDLKIGIDSVGKTSEMIHVGSSKSSVKKMVFSTNTSILFPDDSIFAIQKIPKVIIQTYFKRQPNSGFHYSAYKSFVDLNSEYSFLLFLDNECREIIQKNFPSRVLAAYDLLVPPSYRADFFRYAYLFLYGGCYFDNKMIDRMPLRSVIQAEDMLLVASDALPLGHAAKNIHDTVALYNAIICSQRNEERMLITMELVVKNIEARDPGKNSLWITGPSAFMNALRNKITEHELRFHHGMNRWHEDGLRRYTDYWVKDKISNNVFLTKNFKGHVRFNKTLLTYGHYWESGRVYHENPIVWKEYLVFLEANFLQKYVLHLEKNGTLILGKRFYSSGGIYDKLVSTKNAITGLW